VVARVVDLRLGRDDLIQQFTLAVLLAGFDVRLSDRERLADRAAASRGDDDPARARRAFEHRLPLFLGEGSSVGDWLTPFWSDEMACSTRIADPGHERFIQVR
jgi:hypothetical protein